MQAAQTAIPIPRAVSDREADKSVEQAVHQAQMAYVTDAQKRSLEHWWGQLAKSHIGWSSFRRRATLGGWIKARDQFWRDVSNKVLADRAGELAATQVRELDELTAVRTSLLSKLGDLQPRSFEAAVAALVRLDEHLERKREAVASRLPEAKEEHRPTFSRDEIAAMSRALLQTRLAKQRAEEPESRRNLGLPSSST